MMKLHMTVLMLVSCTLFAGNSANAEVPEQMKQRVEKDGWSQEWHDELYKHEDQAVAKEVRAMLRAKRDEGKLRSGLVVHEWGSMKHQMGTYSSEFDLIGEDQADLPKFVQVWADQPVAVPMMIEKPILYFYTDKKTTVNVNVKFPKGILTQWYPDVMRFTPQRYHTRPGQVLPSRMFRNGMLWWNQVVLDPDADPATFARVDENHPWWHIVRDTDATPALVPPKVNRGRFIRPVPAPRRPAPKPGEAQPDAPKPVVKKHTAERFLFYRGAGDFTPTVMPTPSNQFANLSVRVPHTSPVATELAGAFLVKVKGSDARIVHSPKLTGGDKMTLGPAGDAKPVAEAAATAKAQLTESLEAAGLFPKEAAGLVKIWGDDMFTTPGERLLYVMPRHEADAMLPLSISPKPTDVVRVLITWVEVSTPEAERRVMELVEQLDSNLADEREAAEEELRKLDRFAEAILLRVAKTAESEGVRTKVQAILDSLQKRRQQGKEHLAPATPNTGGPNIHPRPPGVVPVPLPEPAPAPAPIRLRDK